MVVVTQKFYFHDATTTDTGTLPNLGTIDTFAISTGAASGAFTNRSMDGTIGTSQASSTITTLATTTTQQWVHRRFLSLPLAAQTIPPGTWALHFALSESSTNSNFNMQRGLIAVWRPSTGTKVGDIYAIDQVTVGLEAGTSEIATGGTYSTLAFTLQDGDILVYEAWSQQQQGMATAYTNTYFYDGTTEDSATSNAAYLQAPVDLPLFTGASATIPDVIMAPMIGY
jgi:hypothetical protein